MSFRRQADNFMKWRERGVVPVDAFFKLSGRALNARQSRLASQQPGHYYTFDRDVAYASTPQQSEEIRKTSTPKTVDSRPYIPPPPPLSWRESWRVPSVPLVIGPFKIKNGSERRILFLKALEEEVIVRGDEVAKACPDINAGDLGRLVNLAMHQIWGPQPSLVFEGFGRRWQITHEPRE